MPPPLTNQEKGLEGRPATGAPPAVQTAAGPDARLTESKGTTLQQQDPYATRRGPLMSMIAAVERAKREQAEAQARERAEKEAKERIRQGSVVGGAAARFVHDFHQQKADGKHLGAGFGVEWLAKKAQKSSADEKAQEAFFRRKERELEKKGLGMWSCLTMYAASLDRYVDTATAGLPPEERKKQAQRLQEALGNAFDAQGTGKQHVFGGRGTVVLEEMRKGFGFETVHVDAARGKPKKDNKNYTSDEGTRAAGKVPNQEASVKGFVTGKTINVQVGVDRFVKLGKEPSQESRTNWEALKRVEYAIGVADSGTHTFVLSAGKVYEVHWDKGPTDPKLTEASDLEAFFKRWGSGVIAVPPGVLPASPPPAKK
jgi:hypothetical protein